MSNPSSNSSDIHSATQTIDTGKSVADIIGASPKTSEDTNVASSQPNAAVESLQEALEREYELIVDGKKVKEKINLRDDDRIKKALQMEKVSQKRMEETASLKKQQAQVQAEIQEFLDVLKKDPRRILSDPSIGVDLKAFAQAIIQEEIERASKSPEELDREERVRELETARKEKTDLANQLRHIEQERVMNQMENNIMSALDSSTLPKNPQFVRRMADYMLTALDNNIDLSPQDVVPLVEQEFRSELKEMFDVMPEEVLESILGENLKRVRRRAVDSVKKAAVAKPKIEDIGALSQTPAAPKKKISMRDFMKKSQLK